MNTNSAVNQVLVTTGDQALLAKNLLVSDLAVGQLGFFDLDTRLSLSTASTANELARAKRIGIAVGMDANTVKYQAGECIQIQNLRHLSFTPASAEQPQIYDITFLEAKCNREYMLKLEFDGPTLAELNGSNRIIKQYAIKTSLCEDCSDCGTAVPYEFATKMVTAINNDNESLFVATYLDDAGVVIGNQAAFDIWFAIPGNELLIPGIRITMTATAIPTILGYNFNYDQDRMLVFKPYLMDYTNAVGTVTEFQVAKGATGLAYDLIYLEQVCQGWKSVGSVYRILGQGIQKQYLSLISTATKYDYFWLTYMYKAETGSGYNQENQLQTLIAVPEASTTTRTALAALMLVLFPTMDTLVDDAAAASVTPSAVEAAVTSENTDGIA